MHAWDRLLDDARSDVLAQERARERWLRRQAAESATLVGTLLDLAESGAALSMTLTGGRRVEGRLVGVGADVVVLEDRREHCVVRIGAVVAVRPAPGTSAGIATGDRAAALDLGLAELLARFVDDAPEVAVGLVTGEVLGGELVGVGGDVLTVRVARGAEGVVYCSPSAVTSVRFRSG